MVATAKSKLEEWNALMDNGLSEAAGAALERLVTEDAVETEFTRILAKLEAALRGEQNDVTALALHATLIALLDQSLDRGLIQ